MGDNIFLTALLCFALGQWIGIGLRLVPVIEHWRQKAREEKND